MNIHVGETEEARNESSAENETIHLKRR